MLRLLRRQIEVPEGVVWCRYLTATLDLTAPPDEGTMRAINHDGEIVMTTNLPRSR